MKEGKRANGKKVHKVPVGEDVHRRLKIRAAREGASLQVVVGEMLKAQLKVERG